MTTSVDDLARKIMTAPRERLIALVTDLVEKASTRAKKIAALEAADTRRLAAIRTALGHDHDDATGPQTLDDAIAALCLRHAEVLGALATAEEALAETEDKCGRWFSPVLPAGVLASTRHALAAIRKVRP